MDQDSYSLLSDFVYRRCGIYFGELNREHFETVIEERIAARGLSNGCAYYKLLTAPVGAKAEIDLLLDRVTINETSFFRSMSQLNVFRNALFPDVCARANGAGRREVRLWSAGCSSGEEPYTLGILARESLSNSGQLPLKVTILATDLSTTMLARAERARYGCNTLRNVPVDVRDKYFRSLGSDEWEVLPEVRAMVTFAHQNMAEHPRPVSARDLDVVFCRNVLIYFDSELRARIVNSFYQALRPGGFLVLGPAETLFQLDHPFKLVHYNRAQVYAKRE